MYPPVSRRAIVQPVPLMTNPGSLTMGFAGVDPRQLAPSVGTTQVGITISAVPSSARSNQPEEIKITTNISAAPSRPLSLQPRQDQNYDGSQVHHRQRRNRRPRRTMRGLYEGILLDEPQHAAQGPPIARRPTATRTPAARQVIDPNSRSAIDRATAKEEETNDLEGRRGGSMVRPHS